MKSCDLSYHFLEIFGSRLVNRKRAPHSVADGDESIGDSCNLKSADSRHFRCRHRNFFASLESLNFHRRNGLSVTRACHWLCSKKDSLFHSPCRRPLLQHVPPPRHCAFRLLMIDSFVRGEARRLSLLRTLQRFFVWKIMSGIVVSFVRVRGIGEAEAQVK
jgi:hypothetical protein